MKCSRANYHMLASYTLLVVLAIAISALGTPLLLRGFATALLVINLIVITSVWMSRHQARNLPVAPVRIAAVCCGGAILATMVTHWPFRATYALSRPAFDAFSLRIRAGETPSLPVQVGLFRIREVSYNSPMAFGTVCLWTDSDGSGNRIGFIQCSPENLPFNPWAKVILDDGWQFVEED